MPWWLWILVGLALFIAEIAAPGGIILLFFGLAAVILGALVASGWGGPPWFQYLLFSILSIASLITLRGPILRKMEATHTRSDMVDSIVGEPIVLLKDLAPGSEGRAEYRGTSWIAINAGTQTLKKNQPCVVEEVIGVKLQVGRQKK